MKKLFSLIILVFFCSCAIVHNRNKEKKFDTVKITQIKTKGYYFNTVKLKPSSNRGGGNGIIMRVFLENGYTFYVGTDNSNQCGWNVSLDCNIDTTEKLLRHFINKEKTRRKNVQLWNWGKFSINQNKIMVQYYYNFHGDYYLIEETGEVIDSTSFKLLTEYDYRTKKSTSKNEVFHFKDYDITGIEKLIPDKL